MNHQKPQRRTVRASELDRTLEGFDDHVRANTRTILENYHRLVVVPLLDRIDRLEAPWWRRAWERVWGAT